ncbi:AI-2E family transporter [Chondromyces crocatus]|uniref:Permease n=1 Tax=Chondromyces crocatus TaxID=52 RepID=A0A0K1EPX8_CHOCO|nr:AI-2E family transporter [Chondromyces crocatus]AKT42668.1 uncharacterized protein CMC5_068950 [Chondromyces crocatus]
MQRSTKSTLFLTISAVLAVVIVVWARAVLLPFILALIVAYVSTPAVLRLERIRIPRWAAILLVYAIALGAIGGFVAIAVPRLITEGKALTREAPRYVARAREQWLPLLDERLRSWTGRDAPQPSVPPTEDRVTVPGAPPEPAEPERAPFRIVRLDDGSFDVQLSGDVQLREVQGGVWKLEQERPKPVLTSATMLQEGMDRAFQFLGQNSLTLLKLGKEIASAISRGIFTLFITLMLAGYIILTHERILGFFRELWPPENRPSFDRFLRRLDRGLSGVVRGQLLICLVNGVLSAIGFWLFELKYWPILSILAGVMSLIPIFGSILSSIPAVAIGLTQSPATAFGVLAWIVGIHQLEANFLNPKIIGDAAKIHPVLVVFSLLVGEHYFQIAGALFAVPCLSIVQTIFLHFRESALGLPDPTSTIPPGRPAATPPNTPIPPPLPPIDMARMPLSTAGAEAGGGALSIQGIEPDSARNPEVAER